MMRNGYWGCADILITYESVRGDYLWWLLFGFILILHFVTDEFERGKARVIAQRWVKGVGLEDRENFEHSAFISWSVSDGKCVCTSGSPEYPGFLCHFAWFELSCFGAKDNDSHYNHASRKPSRLALTWSNSIYSIALYTSRRVAVGLWHPRPGIPIDYSPPPLHSWWMGWEIGFKTRSRCHPHSEKPQRIPQYLPDDNFGGFVHHFDGSKGEIVRDWTHTSACLNYKGPLYFRLWYGQFEKWRIMGLWLWKSSEVRRDSYK